MAAAPSSCSGLRLKDHRAPRDASGKPGAWTRRMREPSARGSRRFDKPASGNRGYRTSERRAPPPCSIAFIEVRAAARASRQF